ncbi:hypothetical protein RYX36_002348 [Vicia faba]
MLFMTASPSPLLHSVFDITTVTFISSLIILSVLSLCFIFHLRFKSKSLPYLQNFNSLWTVQFLLVLFIFLWSVVELLRLPFFRRRYLYQHIPSLAAYQQANLYKLSVALSLGFFEPTYLVTLLFLLNASIRKKTPNAAWAITFQNRYYSKPQPQQQQSRDKAHLLNGSANGLGGNPGTANAIATKMYEERLKVPLQRDSLDDAAMKQRFGHVLHGAVGGMSPQVQARSQQLPGSTTDMKSDINSVLNPRAASPEGSLLGISGSNQGNNNLILKGWPLTGLEHLRSGLLQQQKPFMQSPQPFHQLQMLTPQQQPFSQPFNNFRHDSSSPSHRAPVRILTN